MESSLVELRSRVSPQRHFEALIAIGFAYRDAGELRIAEQRFREAGQLARQLGDPVAEATTLFGLGDASFGRARFKEAAAFHREAAELFGEEGEWGPCANSVYSLVLSLAALNRPSEAEREVHRLVELAKRLGRQDLVPCQLAQCTRFWLSHGNVKEALDYAVQSLAFIAASWRETGLRRDEDLLAPVAAIEAGARSGWDAGAEAFWDQLYARIERANPVAWPAARRFLDRCRAAVTHAFDGVSEREHDVLFPAAMTTDGVPDDPGPTPDNPMPPAPDPPPGDDSNRSD